MIPVRTQQRYRCEHKPCKKVMIKRFMEIHEEICFFNPDRVCPNGACDNGTIPESYMEYPEHDCPDCDKFYKIQSNL